MQTAIPGSTRLANAHCIHNSLHIELTAEPTVPCGSSPAVLILPGYKPMTCHLL